MTDCDLFIILSGVAADGETEGDDTKAGRAAEWYRTQAGLMLQGGGRAPAGTASAADRQHRASAEDIWWHGVQTVRGAYFCIQSCSIYLKYATRVPGTCIFGEEMDFEAFYFITKSTCWKIAILLLTLIY